MARLELRSQPSFASGMRPRPDFLAGHSSLEGAPPSPSQNALPKAAAATAPPPHTHTRARSTLYRSLTLQPRHSPWGQFRLGHVSPAGQTRGSSKDTATPSPRGFFLASDVLLRHLFLRCPPSAPRGSQRGCLLGTSFKSTSRRLSRDPTMPSKPLLQERARPAPTGSWRRRKALKYRSIQFPTQEKS